MRWVERRIKDWFQHCMPGSEAPPAAMEFEAMNVPKKGHESGMYPGIHAGCIGYLNAVGCADFTVRCTDSLKDKAAAKGDLVNYNADSPDLVIFPTNSDALEAYLRKDDAKQPKPMDSNGLAPGGTPQVSPPVVDSTRVESVPDNLGVAQSSPADISQEDPLDGSPNPSASEAQNAPAFRGQMSWAWTEVLIEVKRSRDQFPFFHGVDGKSARFFPDGRDHVLSRGQIADYAVQVFKHQHRLFVFTILILDDHARLVRFDRNGAVVSNAFDFREHPSILGEFFYRGFNPATRKEQRGHDPTARVASESERETFLNAYKTFANAPVIEKALQHAVSDPQSYPIYKIAVTGAWSADDTALTTESPGTQSSHVCLVGRPEFCSASLVGRGTKGFVALDMGVAALASDASSPSHVGVKTPRAIFIKETWRPDSVDIIPEGEHYKVMWSKALHENASSDESEDVEDAAPSARKAYIPTPICMGDVVSPVAQIPAERTRDSGVSSPSGTLQTADVPRVQRTLTPDLAGSNGNRDLPRIHHRLVLKEICSTLEDFSDPYELMAGVYFALVAHQFAWEKCGILHRDISVGNILLCHFDGDTTGTRVGLLADWDLAKTKEQLEKQQATQKSRSGTWQFMSALLQKYANKPHELADDLESFLHVLNWCAWKYFPHEASDDRTNLATMFSMMFDTVVRDPPQLAQFKQTAGVEERGYADKFRFVKNGHAVVEGLPEGHPFTTLLADLTAVVKRHYDTVDFTVLDKPVLPKQTPTRGTSGPKLIPRDRLPAPGGKVRQHSAANAKETAAARTASTISTQGTAAAATNIPNAQASSSNVLATRPAAVSPLQDHSAIMERFYALLDDSIWENADDFPPLPKTDDQVPYFVPLNSVLPASSEVRGSERSRNLALEPETSSSIGDDDVFSSRPSSAQQIKLSWEVPY
ncbi:hypothetical protein C8T65DRAFT_834548 [Cerioporus squamosus]|nr:hypothetical protein C8T65DRAFT_834548 [Cerioporus squamosus]